MKRVALPLLILLSTASCRTLRPNPAGPQEPGAASAENLGSDKAGVPGWLANAQAHYSDALKAQDKDDSALAEKHLRRALKAIAGAPPDVTLLDLKEDLEAMLSRLEEDIVPGENETGGDAAPGLDVSEQELESAPPVGTPRAVEKKTYAIPIDPEDALVKKYIAIYTGPRRDEMARALERMGRYRAMVERNIRTARMPRELLYLPIVESEFKNTNVSRAGAVGLWQFMKATGQGFGLKVNYWVDERRDPEKATRAALQYLKQLYEWFDDWHLALAAYNRGEYGVQRDMEKTRSPGFALLSERRALPLETEHYVPKFMACVLIADNAASYGFPVVAASPPQTDEVVLGKPIDLKVAAKCAGTTEETLRDLNPTLKAWCTPKNDPNYALKIPAGSKDRFLEELAKVKDWTPYTPAATIKYRVRKGDVLGTIASRYKTTVAAIQKDNRIRDPRRLRPGQTLMIRPGGR